ncbi:hypothetical protein F4779DRAFT_623695 [Xylariaceae sp. FL0662B]|nr:hypothetical protein F4779DRAFT_623695 [Xylariaceae sp. FL0662B]
MSEDYLLQAEVNPCRLIYFADGEEPHYFNQKNDKRVELRTARGYRLNPDTIRPDPIRQDTTRPPQERTSRPRPTEGQSTTLPRKTSRRLLSEKEISAWLDRAPDDKIGILAFRGNDKSTVDDEGAWRLDMQAFRQRQSQTPILEFPDPVQPLDKLVEDMEFSKGVSASQTRARQQVHVYSQPTPNPDGTSFSRKRAGQQQLSLRRYGPGI